MENGGWSMANGRWEKPVDSPARWRVWLGSICGGLPHG